MPHANGFNGNAQNENDKAQSDDQTLKNSSQRSFIHCGQTYSIFPPRLIGGQTMNVKKRDQLKSH
jgi:hypothetical protein